MRRRILDVEPRHGKAIGALAPGDDDGAPRRADLVVDPPLEVVEEGAPRRGEVGAAEPGGGLARPFVDRGVGGEERRLRTGRHSFPRRAHVHAGGDDGALRHRRPRPHPQPELPVLVHPQRFVEPAGLRDERALQQHRLHGNDVLQQQLRPGEAPRRIAAQPALPQQVRHGARRPFRAALEQRDEVADVVRVQLVVVVEEADVDAARPRGAAVAGRREVAVLLVRDLDDRDLPAELVEDVADRLARVVDDDDLDRPVELGGDARQRPPQRGAAVERRHDDRDERPRGNVGALSGPRRGGLPRHVPQPEPLRRRRARQKPIGGRRGVVARVPDQLVEPARGEQVGGGEVAHSAAAGARISVSWKSSPSLRPPHLP